MKASTQPHPSIPLQQRLRDLRYDVPASLVVFLVAVPLSLGIAVASGAPVVAGLIAAVLGGIVVGFLGGAPLQVSGPAAGLTVIVAELIDTFGWGVTCLITVAAGLLQILFGVSRLARVALAISPAVVHGMLAGVGLTIVASQLHVVLGGSAGSSFVDNLSDLPTQIAGLHGEATLLGLGVIALLIIWPRLPRRVRAIPGPLIAIGAATAIAVFTGSDAPRVELPGSILSSLSLPVLPDGRWSAFAVGVITIALVASVETLASAVATDGMHTGRRANLDRELIGQGTANTISGAIGGLPITGVIVRSTTNINAGARTRTSAILHGVWVLVFSALLFSVIELVPLAALAGLLVHVGAKLINLGHLRRLRRHGELLVYLVTVAAVVVLNLLEGVLIGLTLTAAITLYRVMISSVRAEQVDASTWRLPVHGRLSFLSIPRLAHELGRVPAGSDVVIELVTDYLDHAAYEHLHGWIDRHRAAGGSVHVDEIGSAGLDSTLRGGGDLRSQLRRREASARSTPLPRWFTPWSFWQRLERPAEPTALDPLPPDRHADESLAVVLNGFREYQLRSKELVRPHLAGLAMGQRPRAMWITCGDSRVVPNVLTSSGPGDLFTVRNIGNLIPPPHSEADTSVASAIEFAVGRLEVPVLVVCGHSGCGAMQAVHEQAIDDGPLHSWLHPAASTRARWQAGDPIARRAAADGYSEVDQLAMINVDQGLRTLRSYDLVADAVATGRLHLVGLFFDIGSGDLLLLDDPAAGFESVGSHPTQPMRVAPDASAG
ncbi:SulP family inorganic anion transporter [Microlunatus soli]|uniref:carbonic anhydrase n=1 Tax=Microlunatus soli TaxID=630515 RepID=A0A1H1WM76_9ACTN|nr:bifunctional SulP family inorganic anion transporter/carbonic anhydrase [Microlunatus soli]SDS97249.1 carbonic anhydrase [Microlunatus soli]